MFPGARAINGKCSRTFCLSPICNFLIYMCFIAGHWGSNIWEQVIKVLEYLVHGDNFFPVLWGQGLYLQDAKGQRMIGLLGEISLTSRQVYPKWDEDCIGRFTLPFASCKSPTTIDLSRFTGHRLEDVFGCLQ